jgi:hypothetical protein
MLHYQVMKFVYTFTGTCLWLLAVFQFSLVKNMSSDCNMECIPLKQDRVVPTAFFTNCHWMICSGLKSYQLLTRQIILKVLMAAHFLGVRGKESFII